MNTFFVSTNTQGFRRLLQSDRSAKLFIETLYHYRGEGNYLLHEFVVMPHHVHLILTPQGIAIERAMQLIKGGFAFRAKKAFGWKETVWQKSFTDRRLRDVNEYASARATICGITPWRLKCARNQKNFRTVQLFPDFNWTKHLSG